MPRAAAPARSSAVRASNTYSHTNNARSRANFAATTGTGNPSTTGIATRGTTGTVNPATTGVATRGTTGAVNLGTTGTINPATTTGFNTMRPTSTSLSPYTYTYGSGSGARPYRAYGYGRGYRNRYYGGGYGYGRSQGYNRAIVGRLRSVHMSLARLDHDYQGHRARAMHAISMAVRQLTHRSMVYQGTGFAPGANNGMAMGMGRGGIGGAGGRGGNQRMTQAQSDARMSQALRTLQGINMQMSSQGSNTTGHARASGHVQRAVHELNIALSIR